MKETQIRLSGIIPKAALLLVLFNFGFILVWDVPFGSLSLYNVVFPGRERLPFGETRQAYNLSLFDLDAMFASHILAGAEKTPEEYRVLLIGDSSVWGTLLTPRQTLAGQLNLNPVRACGRRVHAYNLGYPTISLMKDLMILDQAGKYEPDMVVWLTTLEAFPEDKQLESPIVANNAERVRALISRYDLPMAAYDPALQDILSSERTFVSRRRAVADLFRLQMYGVLWTATGIDQFYPDAYEPAQLDLAPDEDFHGATSVQGRLALEVLDAGMSALPVPTLLVNEPMLISDGLNSDIRYNFFYPRRAYDEYRSLLAEHAAQRGWHYLDLWNLVPRHEFTNSAIHLTPDGEEMLASEIAQAIQAFCE